ncbi:hypothetical protein CEXT_170111 [Caerostris extrusa]|uniref:Uncharacterized protein n=1 Tax=Caerostris extrusa TaxID=172846 RepID=A0AAV4TD82_CAEEX|nr:hypothetical protein CEXT_170111 [Caerostris extrusa]
MLCQSNWQRYHLSRGCPLHVRRIRSDTKPNQDAVEKGPSPLDRSTLGNPLRFICRAVLGLDPILPSLLPPYQVLLGHSSFVFHFTPPPKRSGGGGGTSSFSSSLFVSLT